MLKPAQRTYPHRQTFRSHYFIKDAFHHLNVPTVGKFTVDDFMDCIFECLTHSLCYALNLAASKGADGKLWCELLSADKYSNPKEYRLHNSLYHFSMEVQRNLFIRTFSIEFGCIPFVTQTDTSWLMSLWIVALIDG